MIVPGRDEDVLGSVVDLVSHKGATSHNALFVDVTNEGPSRSGFASSSAVAMNLVGSVYSVMKHTKEIPVDPLGLGSHVLLFENELGLKSGRQDVDGGILPGLKSLQYPPTDGVLKPTTPFSVGWVSEEAERAVTTRLAVIDTGIQRTVALDYRRGLNSRALAYLRRAGDAYRAIIASFALHARIVQAFRTGRPSWLGTLFTTYMETRATIDPGAVSSIHDTDSIQVLLKVFDTLSPLSSGGMFTGAMGGGVALIVLKQPLASVRDDVQAHLDSLSVWQPLPSAPPPYARVRIIDYTPDFEGLSFSPLSL